MSRRRRRSWVFVAGLSLAVAASGLQSDAGAVPGPDGESRHRSGLTVLAKEVFVPPGLPAAAEATLSEAGKLAASAPEDFSHAWYDRKSGAVRIGVVESAGKSMVDKRTSRAKGIGAEARTVSRSLGALERIKDEAITIGTVGVPDAGSVFRTQVDAENNRVIIDVEQASDAFLTAVAKRYGPDAVAVRVNGPGSRPHFQSRLSEGPDYFGGGARLTMHGNVGSGHCTSGIPWEAGTSTYLITAGHCGLDGAWVSTPTGLFGAVYSDTGENWAPGFGTVFFPGQTDFRGDIAMITISSSGPAAGYYIYRGAVDSDSTAVVTARAPSRSTAGRPYCTGGSFSGELCGWTVQNNGVNFADIGGQVARNMVYGTKTGACARGGDSGAPVYQVRANGTITMLGVHSAHAGNGTQADPCREYFTDYWDVWSALPGDLRYYPPWAGP
ncbi:S1 family peptidase [Yinghuangia soli]|uniref:S1 family peptidase n=1 Tax=Yinghuangia soli TaxID=2908204 RepID=A0AA41TYD8_9ACTN|nr:S1 family peptidase [Yinghuangia soli]MCF2526291.1 S1 family peptidase [Yinghuangia soli]